ncbi:MAG: hypothetical protein ACRCSV_04575 [Chlamydiales bacterium]
MRIAFKKVVDENTIVIYENLRKFLESTWSLTKKVSNLIDQCLPRIIAGDKKYICITILRNSTLFYRTRWYSACFPYA